MTLGRCPLSILCSRGTPSSLSKLSFDCVAAASGYHVVDYMGTSIIRYSALLGPYSRTMYRALWWVLGGGSLSYERGTPVLGGQRKAVMNLVIFHTLH